jgi:hypothetical protein
LDVECWMLDELYSHADSAKVEEATLGSTENISIVPSLRSG